MQEKETKELPTKERILLESMKLFAVQGYEAVSVRMIGAKVGVRDSALYKHFRGKQEIFDTIVERARQRFFEKYEEEKFAGGADEEFEEMCLRMFQFQTKDPWIVLFRQMLIMEQFKNPMMAKTYQELFIDMPVDGMRMIFEDVMEKGMMKKANAKVLAMELYAPFFMYHTISVDWKDMEQLFREHARNFKNTFFIEQP